MASQASSSKRTRVPTSHVEVFIDREAMVDHDEASSEEPSSEDDFIADESEDEPVDAGLPPFRTWDDIDRREEDVDFLERFSEEIKARAKGKRKSVLDHSDELPPVHPSPADPDLWRVQVKEGSERNVVLAILQKSLQSPMKVLSAFARDTIKRCVYIEAPTLKDVYDALKNIAGIARNGPKIDLVPLDERPRLLTMASPPTIRAHTWTRIRRRGTYNRDLGFIAEVNEQTSKACVLLVPRISLEKKRKRGSPRPPPALFSEQVIKEVYGDDSVLPFNQVRGFQGKLYKSGLLEETFRPDEITSIAGVYGAGREIELFSASRHPLIQEALGAGLVTLRAGDKIQVIGGSLAGMIGEVIDVQDNHTVTLRCPDQTAALEVPIQQVCKHFRLGDHVRVLCGGHQGSEGYITEMRKDVEMVVVYRRHVAIHHGVQVEQAGDEIEVNQYHIDWAPGNDTILGTVSQSGDMPSQGGKQEAQFTRDPYKGMQVAILAGSLKRHHGAIIGTRETDAGVLVDVQTTTRVINSVVPFRLQEVRELYTSLPLEKAKWIPRSGLPTAPAPLDRPPTPTAPSDQAGPSSPAWDPASRLEGEDPSWYAIIDGPPPGQWLLDARLLHKRLDVRISGTVKEPFHNGAYENHCGYIILDKVPTKVTDSCVVKLGFQESRKSFQLRFLAPQTTTERPGFVTAAAARPVVSQMGQRVVIIGPDLYGNLDAVGAFGHVVNSGYSLPPSQAAILISQGPLSGQARYYDEKSLCRSHPEFADWQGGVRS